MSDYQVCTKCGKSKKTTDFYKMKDGSRCDMCKTCLTMHIDNRKPDTFLWILEKFDVPYIEDIWVRQSNTAYMKDPAKFGPMSVIGTYMRTMNMAQYREYCYADSDKLNFENLKNREEAKARREELGRNEEYEADLKSKLENGEISEAEYNTLSHTTDDFSEEETTLESAGPPQFIQDVSQVNEDSIRAELSEDDIKYLALKWGLFYKPSQWVWLEKKYQEYASQYELSVDREDVLRKICKVSLKMDEALDLGDTKTFKDLSVTYESLRKSGKFTEAQKQEEERREIDSIGELVAFVEREGGAIPCCKDPIEYPQDKVDFTIRDMKHYVDRLVKEELGLSDLIESFIEKAGKNKTESVEDIMATNFDADNKEVSESEAQSFQEFLQKEVEEESYKLAEEFAGDA